jgi:hypothetical protein
MLLRIAGIRAIFQTPHFSGLRYLSGSSSGDQYGEALVTELARSPYLRQLRCLSVESAVTHEGVKTLAASPVIATLTQLALPQNEGIGDKGAIALASSEGFGELRYLDLYNTALGAEGARAIARSPHLSRVRFLNLVGNPIGDEGGKALCESQFLSGISVFALASCGIGESVAAALRERFGAGLYI